MRERDEESMREIDRWGSEWVRERERERERERRGSERDEESMRIGKERKRAKRDRSSHIFGVLKKYLIALGRKWERKGS